MRIFFHCLENVNEWWALLNWVNRIILFSYQNAFTLRCVRCLTKPNCNRSSACTVLCFTMLALSISFSFPLFPSLSPSLSFSFPIYLSLFFSFSFPFSLFNGKYVIYFCVLIRNEETCCSICDALNCDITKMCKKSDTKYPSNNVKEEWNKMQMRVLLSIQNRVPFAIQWLWWNGNVRQC